MKRTIVAPATAFFLVGILAAQPAADQSPERLKIALVNIKSLFSDGADAAANRANIDANLKRHFYFIDKLAGEGVDFVGFPELSINGYHLSKNIGPHANTTGGTIAGWYKFRAGWAGPDGWIAQLKVYAALHNHAGLYNPEFNPPAGSAGNNGHASGAWFIGPDGKTLAQMPTSTQRNDSKEFVLIHSIPIK